MLSSLVVFVSLRLLPARETLVFISAAKVAVRHE
jgi:hypothetical protein